MNPKSLLKFLSLAAALLFATRVAALDIDQSPTPLCIDIDNGLSNNYISALCKDAHGSVWIATEEGLNRIENARITPYYKWENGLTDNVLNAVKADDARHRIWIATHRAGLCWYDYEQRLFGTLRHDPHDPHSLATDDVTHVELMPDGTIWASTYHAGMERLDVATGRFDHYDATTVEGYANAPIRSFAGKEGVLYIGHYEEGFTVMDVSARRARNYRHDAADPRSLPSDHVMTVAVDGYGRIWAGTAEGLALFMPETGEFIRCTRGAGIFAIQPRQNDCLLLGTEMGGAVEIDLQEAIQKGPVTIASDEEECGGGYISDYESLARLSIRCIMEDDYGNLWFGTYGSGAIVYSSSEFGRFGSWSAPQVLTEEKVLALCFDRAGRLWVGTDGDGVNVLGDKRLTERCRKAVECGVIVAAYSDTEGNVWLGTYTRGGVVYDARRDRFVHIETGDAHGDVRCFAEYGDEMWVGTSRGICVIDKATYRLKRSYTTADGLVDNLVRTLMFDLRGRLWVGTFGQGMALYDRRMELVATFSTAGELASNEINQLHQDRRGDIWAATGEGLVCIDAATLAVTRSYDRTSGLANDHIRAISEDAEGNIWFSTNIGVGCLTNEGTVCNFDHRDGVTSGNFSTNSCATAADGLVCLGSTQGVVYFYPQRILRHYDTPEIRVAELNVLDYGTAGQVSSRTATVIPCKEEITLSWRQNNIRIWFGVSNIFLADRVEYAYKIDSDEWTTTEDKNITLIHLAPGTYKISLRARIRNQAWGEQVETLQLTVRPPWYLAWYTKMLYLLVIAGVVVVSVIRYNRYVERERERQYDRETINLYRRLNDERMRFFMNITHELRTPLTLLLGPLEDLKRDESLSRLAGEKVTVAYRSAVQLLALINELLEFRKTEIGAQRLSVAFDDLSQCIEEAGVLFRDSNQNLDTKIELRIEEGISTYFDARIITTILNNLLSNAMKYTPQGTVTLFLASVEEVGVRYAEFGVRDTGYGIPEEALAHIFERYYRIETRPHITGTGIGLSLVKSMVELHEATITVASKLNEGTVFRIRLRLDNTYPDALCKETEAHGSDEFAEQQQPAESLAAEEKREVVLVIDDNAAIRHYISLSLGDSYQVIAAPDGEEGLRLVREQMPDVVISDIIMPRMDGIELCRRIKQDLATCHIPVILLTAKDMSMDRAEGYAAGADSYITKPFSSSLLVSRIRNLIESRRRVVDQLVSTNRAKQEQAMDTLGPLDNEFLRQLNELIDREIASDKLNVGYLSAELYMDASTLYRKIKGLTGISTNKYILKRRLHKAAELLRSGRHKVFEVAWMVGINSDNYFRQVFREEFGYSPTEYRNSDGEGDAPAQK